MIASPMTTYRKQACVLLACVFTAASWCNKASAEEPSDQAEPAVADESDRTDEKRREPVAGNRPEYGRSASIVARTLLGHAFVLPTGFDAAFITSHFGFVQGFAYLKVEDLRLPDSGRKMDISLAGIMEKFRFGAAIVDWLGLFGAIEGQVLAGADAKSALFRGAGAGLTWEAGVAARLARSEIYGVQLTLRGKVRGRAGMDVTPITLVEALLDDAQQTADDVIDDGLADVILSNERSLLFGGSLSVAKALGQYLGLQLGVEGLFGGATLRTNYLDGEVETQTTREVIGMGATLTGTSSPHFPLGLALEYRYRQVLDQVIQGELADIHTSRHRVGAGFYFTGREDLMLGLYGSTRLWRGANEPEKYFYAQIVMQYFF